MCDRRPCISALSQHLESAGHEVKISDFYGALRGLSHENRQTIAVGARPNARNIINKQQDLLHASCNLLQNSILVIEVLIYEAEKH